MNNNVEFIEVIIRLGYNFCCFFMFLSSIGKSAGRRKLKKGRGSCKWVCINTLICRDMAGSGVTILSDILRRIISCVNFPAVPQEVWLRPYHVDHEWPVLNWYQFEFTSIYIKTTCCKQFIFCVALLWLVAPGGDGIWVGVWGKRDPRSLLQ
jgi:hypothetical protein